MGNVVRQSGGSIDDISKMLSEGAVVKVDARITDIVNTYLEHRRQDVRGLFTALANEDFELIQIVAHDLLGTGGSFGFEGLSIIGRSMESAAVKQKPEEIFLFLEGLAEYLSSVEVVYE